MFSLAQMRHVQSRNVRNTPHFLESNFRLRLERRFITDRRVFYIRCYLSSCL